MRVVYELRYQTDDEQGPFHDAWTPRARARIEMRIAGRRTHTEMLALIIMMLQRSLGSTPWFEVLDEGPTDLYGVPG